MSKENAKELETESETLNKDKFVYDTLTTDINYMKEGKESKLSYYYSFFAFVLIGTVQLISWNSLLNSGDNVTNWVHNVGSLPQTITVVYSTVNFICTALCIMYTEIIVRPLVTYIGLIITAFTAILYSGITYADNRTAMPVYHVVALLMGLSSALIGCSAFGYANYFPRNYGGALSAGLGVAGVISFAVWMIAYYAIFTPNTVDGTRGATWVLNAVILVTSLTALILSYRFLRQPHIKSLIREHGASAIKKSKKTDYEIEEDKQLHALEAGGTEVIEQETIWQTMKATSVLAFLFFFTMFITLFCFPNIGPFRWSGTSAEKNVLVGVFQVGDLVGRYAPNISSRIILKRKALVIIALVRCLLAVTFFLSYKLPTDQFLGHFAFHFIQMAVLAVSNGWVITCLFIGIPDFVKSGVAKARCGSIGLLAILLGITVGLYSSTFATW